MFDSIKRQQLQELIEKSLTIILERLEKNVNGTNFVDTKFNIVSGQEFHGEKPYLATDMIFLWPQGRGLESLAKHCTYFEKIGQTALSQRIRQAVMPLAEKMEHCRKLQHGHLSFAMTPQGQPLGVKPGQEPQSSTFSDLFYGKGLFCVGQLLNNQTYIDNAQQILDQVFADIEAQQFVSGQICFDPKNPAANVDPRKVPEGPRMIALGALADLIAGSSQAEYYAAKAVEYIKFILRYHSAEYAGRRIFFEEVEREKHEPWLSPEGHLICDPGHAIEFTGLSARALRFMRERNLQLDFVESCGTVLKDIFKAVFDAGFQPGPGGIVKAIDARSGEILHSDMPWWSLPETVRAAQELSHLYGDDDLMLHQRQQIALETFFQRYVQPNGFACQTRDQHGEIVQNIPAVPDADPGYHTNLCLLSVL